jgi:hypothetical protein
MRYGRYSRTRAFDSPAAGGAFERLELAPALEHRHGAGLRIEVRLDLCVLVLARDLPHPAARAVAHDEDD